MRVELACDVKAEVGESPVWDIQRGGLWWVDLLRGELHFWESRAGDVVRARVGQSLGFVVPSLRSDSFVVGLADGIGVLTTDGQYTLMKAVEADRRNFRMNDGKCDRQGRLWAGTMNDATHRDGCLYRVDADWQVTKVAESLGVPNGIGWTRNGTRMYFADTGRARLEMWDFDPSNGERTEMSNVIEFDESDGGPDGLTVDAEDCVWVCLWGGHQVRRYAPSGEWLETIEVPALNVASCVFGGDDLRDLYVTTARYGMSTTDLQRWPLSGALFRCRPGVQGVPADPFSGRLALP